MLTLILAMKAIFEIALLALLGQGVLGLLSGEARQRNVVYQVLRSVGQPFVSLARRVTPRVVLDRHLPWVAFLWLAMGWLLVTLAKVSHCLNIGLEQCR
jgi:hypothetical protein